MDEKKRFDLLSAALRRAYDASSERSAPVICDDSAPVDRWRKTTRAITTGAGRLQRYARHARRINISEPTEDSTMPQIVEQTSTNDGCEAQREIIRLALDEIATEVGTALRDAHLDFPVFLTVPNSGDSLATMACPLDPSASDWSHASAIVCGIIGKRLGGVGLRGRALHCAVANATMGAADVVAHAGGNE
jgi:hypothetical protein